MITLADLTVPTYGHGCPAARPPSHDPRARSARPVASRLARNDRHVAGRWPCNGPGLNRAGRVRATRPARFAMMIAFTGLVALAACSRADAPNQRPPSG